MDEMYFFLEFAEPIRADERMMFDVTTAEARLGGHRFACSDIT